MSPGRGLARNVSLVVAGEQMLLHLPNVGKDSEEEKISHRLSPNVWISGRREIAVKAD